jgi:energy-coupling factor transport system permease protein
MGKIQTGAPMRLDPRTKLVVALMGTVVVITGATTPVLTAIEFGLLVMIPLVSTLAAYGRWLLLVLPMALFFGLVTAWAVDPVAGLLAFLKLLSLTTVGYLFFITTPPEDLANALIKAGLPFRAAFVMSAGMQFVPVLGRKARDVFDAQQARGIPMNIGRGALRNAPAFLLPLLVQTFQLAEELAEAMETRGFGRTPRSFYKEFKLKGVDYAAMGIGTVVTIAVVWSLLKWQ